PIKIYGNDSLSSRVAAFQKKTEQHTAKQRTNPFCHGNVSEMTHQKWDKSDPRYGKPPEGSKTEKRGMAAGSHISNEVLFLCEMIAQYGVPNEDSTVSISFGELFQDAQFENKTSIIANISPFESPICNNEKDSFGLSN
ncbi:hypothetical protein AVEN_47559-1, partial [Araneus ventricosus]